MTSCPSTSNTAPKTWSGPRFETSGNTPRTRYPPATRRPFNRTGSIPERCFMGLERPVAPMIAPLATPPSRASRSAALAVLSRYQAHAS